MSETKKWNHPLWRSDGKELYYYGGGADIQLGRQYDVTADGRFLINTLLHEAAAPIALLQNWHPEARQ